MHSTGFSLPLSWTARVVVLTVVVGCSLLCYHMCCICVLNCVSLYFYHHTYVHYAIHVVLHVAYTRYTYLCYSLLSFSGLLHDQPSINFNSCDFFTHGGYIFVRVRDFTCHSSYIHVIRLHVDLNTDILLVHYLSDRKTALHLTHDNDCVRVYAYPLLQAAVKYMHFLLP